MPNLTFWEKWDVIAQSKGFANFEVMMDNLKEKHTNKEIAILLDVSQRTIEMMWVRLDVGRDSLLKDSVRTKRKSQRDGDGFNNTDVKEKWIKMLSEKGFQTLREAAAHYKGNKISIEGMANDLGVTVKSLRTRLEHAGMILPKEEEKAKALNPLGLL